jgi:hypothetical protein
VSPQTFPIITPIERRIFRFLRSINSVFKVCGLISVGIIQNETISYLISFPLVAVSQYEEADILKERRGGRVEKI